jgi:hypothetical protein
VSGNNKVVKTDEADFYAWAKTGVENGWITPSYCSTHEGDPFMSLEEKYEWELGGDPCVVVFKIII